MRLKRFAGESLQPHASIARLRQVNEMRTMLRANRTELPTKHHNPLWAEQQP
jgi:hypothetical protein